MKISFVVPAYNEEAYLAGCLDSVFRELEANDMWRLGENVEVIVVNNASTDGTADVARSYPGVRLVNEPVKGLTAARQAGFAASGGELIANVDSDSRLTPGWISRVIAAFDAEAKLAALSGPFIYYDLTPRQRVLVQVFYATAFVTYLLNRYVFRVGSMVQGGNFVVRRSALEQIGGFNLAIHFYGEDTDLARRLHTVGRVRFTFALKMFSSARRLKHEGILTMAARYSMNYLWTTFFAKPFTDTHIDIREPLEEQS